LVREALGFGRQMAEKYMEDVVFILRSDGQEELRNAPVVDRSKNASRAQEVFPSSRIR